MKVKLDFPTPFTQMMPQFKEVEDKKGCGKFIKKSEDFFYYCGDLNTYFCKECLKKQTGDEE